MYRTYCEQSVSLLLKCSKYWITNTHVEGSECVLNKCCNILINFGSIGRNGIVDICFSAAKNFASRDGTLHTLKIGFKGSASSTYPPPNITDNYSSQTLFIFMVGFGGDKGVPTAAGDAKENEQELPWDAHLYHGGVQLNEEERKRTERTAKTKEMNGKRANAKEKKGKKNKRAIGMYGRTEGTWKK